MASMPTNSASEAIAAVSWITILSMEIPPEQVEKLILGTRSSSRSSPREFAPGATGRFGLGLAASGALFVGETATLVTKRIQ